jgi:hypothetical protein
LIAIVVPHFVVGLAPTRPRSGHQPPPFLHCGTDRVALALSDVVADELLPLGGIDPHGVGTVTDPSLCRDKPLELIVFRCARSVFASAHEALCGRVPHGHQRVMWHSRYWVTLNM